ncbi:MAG: GntR family transcriptional regulator [Aeromicrobium sp.]|nr:GntR family transcriptional regulator [Aeromicrobium sp.]
MSLASRTPVALPRVAFASVAEQAIEAMIADGRLVPGARLNEMAIADELQISRGPVREAIQRLSTEGLVTIRQHRGAFVTEVSDTQLRELYDVRIALEIFSLRRGLQRGEEAQAVYRDLLASNLRLLEHPGEDHPESNFHRSIVAAAGSEALSRSHAQAMRQIVLARVMTIHDPGLLHQAAGHHVPVLELLVAGDLIAAAARLEVHLLTSLERTLAKMHTAAE